MKRELPDVWPVKFVNTEPKKRTVKIREAVPKTSFSSAAPTDLTEKENIPSFTNYLRKPKNTTPKVTKLSKIIKRSNKPAIELSPKPTEVVEEGIELFVLNHITVDQGEFSLNPSNISILPLFSGYVISNINNIEYSPSFRVDESINVLNLKPEDVRLCLTLRLSTIRKLLQYNGFEFAKISAVDTLVNIRYAILDFYFGNHNIESKLLWSTFEENIFQWFRLYTGETSRNIILVLEKLKGKTLEAIGEVYSLTRERVRQIVKRVVARLRMDKASYLHEIWDYTLNEVNNNYGIISLNNLSKMLKERFHWRLTPNTNLLKTVLTLNKMVYSVDDFDEWVYNREHPCIKCKEMPSRITALMNKKKYLHVKDVIPHLSEICKKCRFVSNNPIPEELVMFHVKNMEPKDQDITVFDNVIIEKQHYRIQHGSIIKSAITFLKSYGKAMHFTELSKHLREYRKQEFSDHNVHSCLNLSNNVMLWDKGTFIHKDCVVIPKELISKIEKWFIEYLEEIQPYPCASVYGALRKYRAELNEFDIKSAQALYSCLRTLNNPELGYPRYPYVHLAKYEYQTPYNYIENYILEKNDWVPLDTILHFLHNIMLFETAHALNITKDISRMLIDDDYNYIHLHCISFEPNDVENLISSCLKILQVLENASSAKLYNDLRPLCTKMGIRGSKMLFTFLQNYAPEELNLSCYPQVWPANKVKAKKVKNISRFLNEHVATIGRSFQFDEIKTEFCDARGYNEKSLYQWFIFNKNLLTYKGTSRIHKSLINWSQEKQIIVEDLAIKYYKGFHTKYGFATVREFVFANMDKLPLLPGNFEWTQELAYSVLTSSHKIRFFGSSRNAYIIIPNDFNVYAIDDLVAEILKQDFNGKALIQDLTDKMQDLNVVRNKLSNSILARSTILKITGNEIEVIKSRK